jgi:O-glycosyl hydrolase
MKKNVKFCLMAVAMMVVSSCTKSPDESVISPTESKSSSLRVAATATGGSISIPVDTRKQKITLMGGGCYFWSKKLMDAPNIASASDWLWKDLGVNVFRIVLRNGGVEDTNDNNDPNNTDFTKFKFESGGNTNNIDQVRAVLKAKEKNPNIAVWAVVLSPPKFLKTNASVNNGGTIIAKTSTLNSYAELGESIYAHLDYLKKKGVTVNYLTLMNEPDFPGANIGYESAEYTPAQAKLLYKETVDWLRTKLSNTALGIPFPSISGPECIDVKNNTKYMTELEPTGNISFYSCHQYNNSSAANFQTVANATNGKDLFMSENHAGFGLGATPDELTSALDMVNKFHDAFKGGAKGWLYFEWGNPEVNFGGLLYTPTGADAVRKKNYYAFKQYSDGLLSKSYVSTTLTGITNFGNDNVSAFSNTNSAIVNVVNWNASAQNRVRLNFGKTIKTIKIIRTSATESNKEIWNASNVNLTYYDVDYAPKSLTTVRITW